jgi:hypothetical protein
MSQASDSTHRTGRLVKLVLIHKIDLIFAAFMIALTVHYIQYVIPLKVPMWDAAVYLENAENWLEGEPLFRHFRPQLISWLIAGIWSITGENWLTVKFIQVGFTLGAGILLYFTLKKHKGSLFAAGVASLTMLNAQVFYYSAFILTEGISLFFLVLALYFLKHDNPRFWSLGGISMGLTFAARYPIILQAFAMLITETLIRKNPRLFMYAMIGAIPTISVIVLTIFLKAGTFEVALEKDTGLTYLLSSFYVLHAIPIWSYAVLLVPAAFLFKKTYRDKYNYTFISWFLVAILFWSANVSNHQERFAIQFTPAVYYLAILTIENILSSKTILIREKRIDTTTSTNGDKQSVNGIRKE